MSEMGINLGPHFRTCRRRVTLLNMAIDYIPFAQVTTLIFWSYRHVILGKEYRTPWNQDHFTDLEGNTAQPQVSLLYYFTDNFLSFFINMASMSDVFLTQIPGIFISTFT
jgi:hypothetical protein